MTQSIIGALRVTLGLDSAQFTRGTRQVEGSMQRVARQARRLGAAMTLVGTGIALAVRGQLNAAAEIATQAQLANATTEEFQRAAAAARSVGIETDQLADIYKDMSDRIGDFLSTGGGPMADFFENIAPQVGLTAEAFRDLSGPQALQQFYSSLEQAGLSANEMTFYMEAIASDATALIPLLANSGAEMNRLADAAQRAGIILSDDTIASARQFNENMRTLGDTVSGFVTVLTANLAPVIEQVSGFIASMAERFQELSPEVQRFASIAAAVFVVGGPLLVGLGLVAAAIGALATPFALAVAGAVALATAAVTLYANWESVREWFGERLEAVAQYFTDAWTSVTTTVSTWASDARQWGRDTIRALGEGIAEMATELVAAIAGLWEAVRAELASWPGRLVQTGRDIVTGLIDGIRGGTPEAVAETEALANRVNDAAFTTFETQSPSRLFRRIGEWLTQGLAQGIEGGAAAPVSAMNGMAQAVASAGETATEGVSRFASGFASFIRPILDGTQTIGDAFAQMASRIADNLINSGLQGLGGWLGGLFGFGGGGGGGAAIPKFSGGGYTGNGARSGGMDGQGGFLAMMHPQETVIDHTRGQSGGGGEVVVRLAVPQGVTIEESRQIAGDTAIRVVAEYDRTTLPDSVQAINRDPRRRAM